MPEPGSQELLSWGPGSGGRMQKQTGRGLRIYLAGLILRQLDQGTLFLD